MAHKSKITPTHGPGFCVATSVQSTQSPQRPTVFQALVRVTEALGAADVSVHSPRVLPHTQPSVRG